MLLSCRILQNAFSVNAFDVVKAAEWTQGDVVDLYLQLIDVSQDRKNQPPGRRYMPVDGASLQITVDSLDDDKVITHAATQPFDQDPSIWKVQILTTDPVIVGTANIRLELTEGAIVTRGSLKAGILVYPSGV